MPDPALDWIGGDVLVRIYTRQDGIEDLSYTSAIEKHLEYTGSPVAKGILDNWSESLKTFVKVMPTDYKRALERQKAEAAEAVETN